MAMIKCPKCNEQISDKSEKCVHCGHILVEETKYLCEECGSEIKDTDKQCSKCGCPVNKNEIPQKVEVTKVKIGVGISKKKILIGLISIVIIILIIIGAIFIHNKNMEKEAERLSEEYKENLSTLTYKMLSGASSSEDCGNKIKKVWSNTIWKEDNSETDRYTKENGRFKDDFNDSLSSLFADPNFIKITNSVEKNQDDVNDLMKKMKNPPEEWEDAYGDLKDYYDNYLTLTNLCTNPTGSLQTYSTNFSNADTDVLNSYNKLKSYLDD